MARWWSRLLNILVILSFLGITVVSVQSSDASHETHRLAECVSSWAGRYTTAAQLRADANTTRVNALHKLLLDAIQSPTQVQTNKDQLDLIDALSSGDTQQTLKAAGEYAKDLERNRGDPTIVSDVLGFVQTETNYQDTIRNHPFPVPPKEVCK